MARTWRHALGAAAAMVMLAPAGAAHAAPLDPDKPTHETVQIDGAYATCPEAMRAVGELDRTVHLFRDDEGEVVREFRNLSFDGQLVGANGMSLPYVGHWRITITYEDGVITGSTFTGLSRMVTLPDGSRLIAAGRVVRDASGVPVDEFGSNTLTEWEEALCTLLATE